ncbi:hypothetical protein DES30_101874 [Prauserella marina]|nr:hypothetical protein DES30_101874 [Prauserella marina]
MPRNPAPSVNRHPCASPPPVGGSRPHTREIRAPTAEIRDQDGEIRIRAREIRAQNSETRARTAQNRARAVENRGAQPTIARNGAARSPRCPATTPSSSCQAAINRSSPASSLATLA